MGDIARVADDDIELHIEVAGSAPIERLDIFNGPDLIETVRTYDAKDLAGRVRLVYTGAEYRGRARTTVWDGSLALGGTTLTDARMFNNWNLDRGIRSRTADGLAWKAVTTGNFGGIDLWLANGDAGTISFETPHCRGEREIAALGVEPARLFRRRARSRRDADALAPHDERNADAPHAPHRGSQRSRHTALRPRHPGGRPPRLVEPDVSIQVASSPRSRTARCACPRSHRRRASGAGCTRPRQTKKPARNCRGSPIPCG